MRSILSGLFIAVTLAACSPSPHEDMPCHHGRPVPPPMAHHVPPAPPHPVPPAGRPMPPMAKEHMPCHCPKGFCPHEKHAAPRDWDVKHDADWHNSHPN